MDSLLNEKRHEVSATLHVDGLLRPLLAEKGMSTGSTLHRLRVCRPASPNHVGKASPRRVREHRIRRRQHSRELSVPLRQELILDKTAPQQVTCDMLEQLRPYHQPSPPDKKRPKLRADQLAGAFSLLLSTFWRRIAERANSLFSEGEALSSQSPKVRKRISKPRLSNVTLKSVSGVCADPFRHAAGQRRRGRRSHAASTSVTPVHMNTEGDDDSRSGSPVPALFTTMVVEKRHNQTRSTVEWLPIAERTRPSIGGNLPIICTRRLTSQRDMNQLRTSAQRRLRKHTPLRVVPSLHRSPLRTLRVQARRL